MKRYLLKMNLTVCAEDIAMLDYLEGEITQTELDAINLAREFVKQNSKIIDSVDVNCDMHLTPSDEEEIEDGIGKFDVQYITVFPTIGEYWYLQNKYDSRINAEYSIDSITEIKGE